MLKNWRTNDFVIVALLSAAYIVADLIFASAVVAVSGIPLSSALITGLIAGFFLLITVKLVPKPGAVTLLMALFAVMELPTSLGGAPGFWPKIPINVLAGLLGDVWLYFTGYHKRWNLFVGFYILAAVNLASFIFFLVLMKIPNAEKTLAIAHWLILVYWIIGTIGIALGLIVWNKIKDKKIVKSIGGRNV
jgi:hypothetical protein